MNFFTSSFRHLREARSSQLARLREWETEINKLEELKITVENDADLEGPPRHMRYITENKPSSGIIIPDEPILSCECESCDIANSEKNQSCCPDLNESSFPYTKHGYLRLRKGTPIYECNKG